MINQKFVRKIGDSLAITIPKNKCETMGIRENTLLKVDQVGNTLVLTPIAGLSENKKEVL